MSPTVLKEGSFRFFFFSREETRMHVHVELRGSNVEAKFWLEPRIDLATNYGMNDRQISATQKLVEDHADEIRIKWKKHFGG